MDTTLLLEFIAAVLVIIGIILYLRFKSDTDKKAKFELDSFADELKNIIIAEAQECAKEIPNKNFNSVSDFENYVLDRCTNSLWITIDLKLDKAVSEKLIPFNVRKIINREYVKKYLPILMAKFNINSDIRSIYCENAITTTVQSMEAEENRINNEFPEDLYFEDEEEVDNLKPGDLEPDTTREDIVLLGNEVVPVKEQTIIPPKDEVDISEAITEDVIDLTEEEKAAGIHFNKSGRKVDAKGRFVKLKN